MRPLLILAALLATAHGAALGSDKCTWGPAYWCSSVTAAGRCSAFAHCMQGVWGKTLADFLQTETCTTSVNKVQLARRLLVTKNEKDSATQILTSLCTLVTDSERRKECKEMVVTYLPLALELLTSSLKDDQVAWVLGLCEPAGRDVAPVKYQPSAEETRCKNCYTFVTDITARLGKDGGEKLQGILKSTICSEMADMAPVCKLLVENTIPDLLSEIANEAQPGDICRLADFCSNRGEEPKFRQLFKKTFRKLSTIISVVKAKIHDIEGRVECYECQKVVTSVKNFGKDSPLRSSVENAFMKLCMYEGLDTEECGDLSWGLFSQLDMFLYENLEPSSFCSQEFECIDSDLVPPPSVEDAQTPVYESSSCSDCEKFYSDISAILHDEDSVTRTVAFAKKTLCQNVGSLQYECNAMVDRLLPVLLGYISNSFTPASFCGSMAMCSPGLSPKFDIMKVVNLVPTDVGKVGDIKCEECMAIVGFLQNLDRDAEVQTAVRKLFNDTCALLGQEAKQCQALAAQYAPQLFEIIASELDPESVCDLFLHCFKSSVEDDRGEDVVETNAVVVEVDPHADVQQSNAVSAEVKASIVDCDICRFALEVVEAIVSRNRTEQSLVEALQQVCSLLTPSARPQCEQFINNYMPTLIRLLLQELDPEVICNELQLCNETDNKVPETAHLQAASIGSIECEVCELVLGAIDSVLDGNRTLAAIEKVLGEICSILPATIRAQCVSFVSEYGPAVMELLADELDPQVVCIKIGLCNQAQVKQLLEAEDKRRPQATPVCELCNQVMQLIETFLQQNRTEETVTKALQQVCSFFPDTISTECRQFVGRYSQEVINLLLQDLNATDICKKLGLCSDTRPVTGKELTTTAGDKKPSAGPICDLCKQVLQTLDSLLEKNRTVDDIEKALDQVCRLFPATISSQCRQLVAQYAPQIIEYIADELKPEEICSLLGLCSQGKKVQGKELTTATDEQKPAAGPICDLCKEVLQAVDSLLEKNRTVDDIEKALDQVCRLFPATISSQCRQLVGQYAPQIIEYITEELKPEEICSLLGLCSQGNRDQEAKPVMEEGKPKLSAGPICELCKVVLTTLDSLVEKNSTVDDIQKGLDKVCSLFPGTIASQCRQLVAQYSPEIVQLLLQQLNPSDICLILDLCTKAGNVQNEAAVGELKPSAGPICDLCKEVLQKVDTLLEKNRTVDDIEKALDQVCRLFPASIASQCRQLVAQYAPALIDLIVEELQPDEICSLLKLCSQSNKAAGRELITINSEQKLSAGPICDLCKQVLQTLDSLLEKNRTVDDIEKALDQVCRLFPATIASQCRQLVGQYAPQIIEYIADELKPEEICSLLKLCSQGKKVQGKELTTAADEQKPAAGPICDLCKEVLQAVDSLLEKNRTVDDIEKALDQVCRLFPATISSQCRQLVGQYAPQIIEYIAEELKPEEICSLLGLCSQGHNELASVPTPEPKMVAKIEDDFECALCQLVISEVNKLLGNNRTETAIIKAVETVCDLMSGDLKLQCQSEVQNYGPAVIDLLQHLDDPETVCQAIKFCLPKLPLAAGREVETQAVAVREGELCLICDTLLNYVEEGLNQQATVEEVEKLLNDVCKLFPTDLTSECSLLVQQFTPLIMQLLAEEVNPKAICETIKLCPSPNSTSHPKFLGLDPCTFGPAYWCAKLENAEECGVVERCVKDHGLVIN
ncbi:uncharacterized protein LOC112576500 isoform X2 [Pomacea canaliculata]|uniref:uncharacterized protein LOC112576500 isoform X2 n=1 Tax=Pomacea canaliculata TaxID=400727 RepID=UPI000D73917E|nr:uncharacterized protein LOC112576500 isoform X2 [Pomacea canaliculata]